MKGKTRGGRGAAKEEKYGKIEPVEGTSHCGRQRWYFRGSVGNNRYQDGTPQNVIGGATLT